MLTWQARYNFADPYSYETAGPFTISPGKLLVDYPRIMLIRDKADLPYETGDPRERKVQQVSASLSRALAPFYGYCAASGLLQDLDALLCTRCADDDPEYLLLKDNLVKEIDFDTAEDRCQHPDCSCDYFQNHYSSYIYKSEYDGALEDIWKHASKVVDMLLDGTILSVPENDEERISVLFGFVPAPDENLDDDTAFQIARDFKFLRDLTEWRYGDFSKLSTIKRAWLSITPEKISEYPLPRDRFVNIKDIKEALCWIDVEKSHAAGVPIEDILV